MRKNKSDENIKKIMKKQSGFLKEFRDFAVRGSVIDLAVGVIIGGAFQGIINSIVFDLINPLIGLIFKSDFSSLYLPLFNSATGKAAGFEQGMTLTQVTKDLGLPVFAYGNFISNVINFIIMAFVIFLLVKMINKLTKIRLKKDDEAAQEVVEEVKVKECPYCFTEIDVRSTRCPHCTSVIEE